MNCTDERKRTHLIFGKAGGCMLFKPNLLRKIAIVVGIVGLIVLISSTKIGMSIAEGILLKQGSMNTDQYRFLQASYIEIYKWMGVILLGVGLTYALQPMRDDEKIPRTEVEENKRDYRNDVLEDDEDIII